MRDIIVSPDTLNRSYNWSQYVDSAYNQLVIRYMEVVPRKERTKTYKNGKVVQPPKKDIDLKEFGGVAWNNQLFRPYISRETENRLKLGLRHR